ncbi:HET-domain-containing protein [Thozetella sp. PMI_491]|nr:HET-domain-containing protein [Thozetella sp. PMI_491]
MDAAAMHEPGPAMASRTSYGRACINCSRIKSKCTFRDDPNRCERCQRLDKECLPSVPARKRGNKAAGSRTAQLEEKVDQMVSLLRSQTAILETQQTLMPFPFQPPYLETADPMLFSAAGSVSRAGAAAASSSTETDPSHTGSTPATASTEAELTPSPLVDDISQFSLQEAIAEEQLERFRSSFLPFFPVIHLPPEMSAEDVRRQKPFFWLVIMSLTSRSTQEQDSMGDAIRRIISQRVVAEHEWSLDVLLGLICYLAWYHYHKRHKLYLIMWSQLAVALVFELGIHIHIPGEEGQLTGRWANLPTRPTKSHVRTMEERRAVIGTFLVTSMVWTSLRRSEPLRWTPYMDECVHVLRKGDETSLDIILAAQAKCHVLVDHVTRFPLERASTGDGSEARPTYFIKAMDLQLKEIRRNLPEEVKSSRMNHAIWKLEYRMLILAGAFSLVLFSTEVIVKEAFVASSKDQDEAAPLDLERLEGLESLLTSLEQWFKEFFALSFGEWMSTTFTICAQYSHCINILFRLSTLRAPGWDAGAARRRVDVLEMLDRIIQRVERLIGMWNIDHLSHEESAIVSAPRRIRGIREELSAQLSATDQLAAGGSLMNTTNCEYFDESFPMDTTGMYSQDYPWLMDVLGMRAQRSWEEIYDVNSRLGAYHEAAAKRQNKSQIQQSSSNWYQYDPLPAGQWLRLLHIQPGGDSTPLQVSLTVEDLSNPPPFQALSYTWGDPSDLYEISCDGQIIQVTKSLRQALCRIRHTDRAQTLWADALCINQGDIDERTSQVLLMNTIYRVAESVFVWLGEEAWNSPDGFRLLHRLGTIATSLTPELHHKQLTEEDMKKYALDRIQTQTWVALDAIYWRPWFKRIWIVQEVALGRNVTIHCGPDSISWQNFRAATLFIQFNATYIQNRVNVGPQMPLFQARDSIHNAENPPLISLLVGFRNALATNPVDKLYGLLGLTSHGGKIIPNYRVNTSDTFRNLFADLLLQYGLDTLSFVKHPTLRYRMEGLPSWAADWSRTMPENSFLTGEFPWNKGLQLGYRACGQTVAKFRFSDDRKRFYVQGRVLGTINCAGRLDANLNLLEYRANMTRLRGPLGLVMAGAVHAASDNALRLQMEIEIAECFRAWELMVRAVKHYHTGEHIDTVLHRTIIADDPGFYAKIGTNDASRLAEYYTAFWNSYCTFVGESRGKADEEKAVVFYKARLWSWKRKLFTTKQGHVGLGPSTMRYTDCVALLSGGKTAYILRKTRESGVYLYIGEAYLHGFMHGEGFSGTSPLEELCII